MREQEPSKHLAVVDGYGATDTDGERFAPALSEEPLIHRSPELMAVRDACMLHQVFRLLRSPSTFEVFGTRGEQAPTRSKATRAQGRIGQIREPKSHIEAPRHEVRHAIFDLDLDAKARVRGKKARQIRRHVSSCETDRGRNAQRSSNASAKGSRLFFRFTHVVENQPRAREKHLACLSQRQASRRALHERNAKPLLKAGHGSTHGSRGHLQGARRSREALQLDDPDEHAPSFHGFFVRSFRHGNDVVPHSGLAGNARKAHSARVLTLVPFETLGGADHGWLNAHHHFSFAEYRDDSRVHFGPLRVWNDDRIAPHTGFGMHPHRDMEIVTYVRTGAITHGDHLGNVGCTGAGDVQVMSAGTGVMHSERNDSDEYCEIFQVWVLPRERNRAPRWEQRAFPKDRPGEFVALASGRPDVVGALYIDADATLYGLRLEAGMSASLDLAPGRIVYAVAVNGPGKANGQRFNGRDGFRVENETTLTIEAETQVELCVFELPGPADHFPAPR